MSRWPYDTGSSFVRYPSYYVHDAFGHVGDDDRGVRAPCFRIPHSGVDVSPDKQGDTSAKVVSPVYGEVVNQGFDKEAGNYHIVKHDHFNEWWILGHHSRFERTSGRVERGDLIARMGATGGAHGVHTHIAVATSYAGAVAYIVGWTQYRNGRSVSAWARQAIRGTEQRLYGLLDPWPLIEREWADEKRRLVQVERDKEAAAAAAAEATRKAAEAAKQAEARREEEEMSAAADDIKSVVRRENRPRLKERAKTGELMLVSIKEGYLEIWHPKDRPNWADDMTRNHEAILTHDEVNRRQKLDETQWALTIELAQNQLARVGAAAAAALSSPRA